VKGEDDTEDLHTKKTLAQSINIKQAINSKFAFAQTSYTARGKNQHRHKMSGDILLLCNESVTQTLTLMTISTSWNSTARVSGFATVEVNQNKALIW
jgi:hypothetical protein